MILTALVLAVLGTSSLVGLPRGRLPQTAPGECTATLSGKSLPDMGVEGRERLLNLYSHKPADNSGMHNVAEAYQRRAGRSRLGSRRREPRAASLSGPLDRGCAEQTPVLADLEHDQQQQQAEDRVTGALLVAVHGAETRIDGVETKLDMDAECSR